MKKKRITYGVSGMMEYQAVIKVGKSNMKVLFTDGSVSAMGVNPATFTTENFIVQHAIENSSDFKRGLIKVLNTIELKEELRIERNSVNPCAGEDLNLSPTPVSAECASAAAEGGENIPDTQTDTETKTEEDIASARVEFACNDDAKDYLEETFGITRSKLRNREEIIQAGKAHNVEITFT